METLRRIFLNRTSSISEYEKVNNFEDNIEYKYENLFIARKTRLKFLLFLLFGVLVNDICKVALSDKITFSVIFSVKIMFNIFQYLYICIALSVWKERKKTLFNSFAALVFEFLTLFIIIIPYYDLDTLNGISLFLETVSNLLPYLFLLFSTKSIIQQLTFLDNPIYSKLLSIVLFIYIPIYIFITGIVINLVSFIGSQSFEYKKETFILLYLMTIIFLYDALLNKYTPKNIYFIVINTLLDYGWIVCAVLIINWVFIDPLQLLNIVFQASIRIYKFRILIQDFVIYIVEDFEDKHSHAELTKYIIDDLKQIR